MHSIHRRIVLLAFCLTLGITNAFAKLWYVAPDGDVRARGNSWAQPNDLQRILKDSAVAGDAILVKIETYKPTKTGDRNASFLLKAGVVLLGGFGGIEPYPLRFPDAPPPILSGDIDLVGNADSYHVVRRDPNSPPLTAATVLDRFIITGGRADDLDPNSINSGGAGLYLFEESLTLIDCQFINNTCRISGAAVSVNNGSPIFTNCQCISNRSGVIAAAVFATGNGIVKFDKCFFKQNTANGSPVLHTEGAIKLEMLSTICVDNTHSGAGLGTIALLSSSSKHLIANSLFVNNVNSFFVEDIATAILSEDSVDIYNCSFSQIPYFPGAVAPFINARANVSNCIFRGSSKAFQNQQQARAFYTISEGGLPNCTNCPGGNGNVLPLFVNVNDPDGPDNILGTADDGLRLSAYSPGVNAGIRIDDVIVPSFDITGKTRDRKYDIGAYEGGYCTGTTLTRLYVNAASTSTNPTGSSWSDALGNLHAAINVATACNSVTEIWVAKGVYKTSDTRDRTRTFSMVNGVAIYGGFAGNETELAQRNPKTHITTLSGDIDDSGLADAHQIIWNANIGSNAVLDGFTISGARNTVNPNGGAIYNIQSSPVFRNCVIMDNTTTGANANGAGMFNATSSNPLVLNCVFDNNIAISGGAVFNAGAARPVFRNCVFNNNAAFSNGGAMATSFGTPTLINCTVVSNKAAGSGGGVYYSITNAPVIANCIFWNNGGSEKEIGYEPTVGSQAPVVSFSYIFGGYAPCFSCTSNNLNPLFLSTGNFPGSDGVWGTVDDLLHLRDGSPARNNGNNAVVADATDMAGQPRIQNTTVNMGAYENLYFITLDNGDWNNANNWNYKFPPSQTDPVLIQAGHQITLKQPGNKCRVLVMGPNARLLINPDGGLRIP